MRMTGSRVYTRPTPIPKMPPGLVELMEGLTKEVLKSNPSDIYDFCATHMHKLLEIRDGSTSKEKQFLSLDQKVFKAQEKVRRRAEERRKKYDKETEQQHGKGFDKNIISDEKKMESYVQEPLIKNRIKTPVSRELDLANASEVEISHDHFVSASTIETVKDKATNNTTIDKEDTLTEDKTEINEKITQNNIPNEESSSDENITNLMEKDIDSKVIDKTDVVEVVSIVGQECAVNVETDHDQKGDHSTVNGEAGPNQNDVHDTVNNEADPNQTGDHSTISGEADSNLKGYNFIVNGDADPNQNGDHGTINDKADPGQKSDHSTVNPEADPNQKGDHGTVKIESDTNQKGDHGTINGKADPDQKGDHSTVNGEAEPNQKGDHITVKIESDLNQKGDHGTINDKADPDQKGDHSTVSGEADSNLKGYNFIVNGDADLNQKGDHGTLNDKADPDQKSDHSTVNPEADPNQKGDHGTVKIESDPNQKGDHGTINDKADPDQKGDHSTVNGEADPNQQGDYGTVNIEPDPNQKGDHGTINDKADVHQKADHCVVNVETDHDQKGDHGTVKDDAHPNQTCEHSNVNDESNPKQKGDDSTVSDAPDPNQKGDNGTVNCDAEPNQLGGILEDKTLLQNIEGDSYEIDISSKSETTSKETNFSSSDAIKLEAPKKEVGSVKRDEGSNIMQNDMKFIQMVSKDQQQKDPLKTPLSSQDNVVCESIKQAQMEKDGNITFEPDDTAITNEISTNKIPKEQETTQNSDETIVQRQHESIDDIMRNGETIDTKNEMQIENINSSEKEDSEYHNDNKGLNDIKDGSKSLKDTEVEAENNLLRQPCDINSNKSDIHSLATKDDSPLNEIPETVSLIKTVFDNTVENFENNDDFTSKRVSQEEADQNNVMLDTNKEVYDIEKNTGNIVVENSLSTDSTHENSNASITVDDIPHVEGIIRNDVHQSSNMDLETAAITIQKVFRTFLFKSRGSTFDDSVNDYTNSVDDDNDDKDENYSITSPNLKERRPLGITRMDSVLQTVNEEKSLSLSTDDSSTLSSAATIIQAHVKGFLVRNKLNSNKTVSANSLLNTDVPSTTSLESDTDPQKKTVLNIHIVPEGGSCLSRDESIITSMDLSLDGSPPSSINLHPLGYNKSERRKQLKREDAFQSISPPSNNSGKLSEDVDSVIEQCITDDNFKPKSNSTEKVDIENREITPVENTRDGAGLKADYTEESNSDEQSEVNIKTNRKSLTKMSSDEMDVVTPFVDSDEKNVSDSDNKSKLLHSGEFHDIVLPTKVSRSDTSVVREFKTVLVYFLLWDK